MFNWSFIGVTTLAVMFIGLGFLGVIATWIIAVACTEGAVITDTLLYDLRKECNGHY